MPISSTVGQQAALKFAKAQELVARVIDLDPLTRELLVLPILGGGHAQLRGPLATGKTSAVMALAKTMDLAYALYQCTSDTMPSDLLGFERFNQVTRNMEVRPGPALTSQILLMDEWNRMPPKPQSALLGVMTHGQVPIGDQVCTVKEPFVVFATRNPIDTQGVYPLPEAAIDRCMLEIAFPAHSYDALPTILGYANASATREKIESIQPVLDASDIQAVRAEIKTMTLGDAWRWATALYLACQPSPTGNARPDPRAPSGWDALKETNEVVQVGPSARGLIDLVQATRALSFLRMAVNPAKAGPDWKDFEDIYKPVLRHRVILKRMLPKEYSMLAPDLRVDHFLGQAWKEAKRRYKELRPFPGAGLS
jgi:MoxR-like ATPase